MFSWLSLSRHVYKLSLQGVTSLVESNISWWSQQTLDTHSSLQITGQYLSVCIAGVKKDDFVKYD